MTPQGRSLLPVLEDLANIAPREVNHALLLDVVGRIIIHLQTILPPRRAGFTCGGYFCIALYQDLTQLAHQKRCPALASWCARAGSYSQKVNTRTFPNGKHQRAVPGQPAMSRFLAAMTASGLAEEFSNALLLGTFLHAKARGLLEGDLPLIAAYVTAACQKDKGDPVCFGSKNGKSFHDPLTSTVISKGLHVVVANYKIRKRHPSRLLFDATTTRLKTRRQPFSR